jgi:acetylglutamate synthase
MVHGMMAQAIKLNINVNIGTIIKTNKLTLLGKMGSFVINLKPYAKGYNNLNNLTTLGPFLRCMETIILRSAKTKKTTPSKRGISIPSILAKIPMVYNLILLAFLISCSMLKAMKNKIRRFLCILNYYNLIFSCYVLFTMCKLSLNFIGF